MIHFQVKGAIFDVDDTLLNNNPGMPTDGLHERARLAAAHEVGRTYGIAALASLSPEENLAAFMTAPVHTLEAAVWNILRMAAIVDSELIDPDHLLLKEIVALKDASYKDLLLNEGDELPGASKFIRLLAANGLEDKLAIASTAIRRDVKLFLGKVGLNDLFPDERIKTKESITHPKPNPEVFNLAFESLELPESDRGSVYAFEDDPRGILAARLAGLRVCAIASRFSVEELQALEVQPHYVARSYQEFIELFGLATEAQS